MTDYPASAPSDSVITLCQQRLASFEPHIIDGEYLEAAVLVAISHHGGEPGVILTRRAKHLNLHPGEAAFPGGKYDAEDADLQITALREAEEEIDLSRQHLKVHGQLGQRLSRTNIRVTPYVATLDGDVILQANLNELDCIYTVPLDFLCQQKNLHYSEVEHQGRSYQVAYYTYQQHRIWGLTASIMVELVNTVFDAGLERR